MNVGVSTKPLRLVDQLVEDIFDEVLEGRIPLGGKITEDEIATRFKVSRTPVREAVKRLADVGVLVIRPRCGVEVASFDEQDLQQILELRVEYECFALRRALECMTEENIEKLVHEAAVCEALLKSKNRVQIFRADSQFHLQLAHLAGNKYLAEAMQRLDVKVQLCRMIFCKSMTKIKSSVKFHWRILDAIREGNGEQADALLREHILS